MTGSAIVQESQMEQTRLAQRRGLLKSIEEVCPLSPSEWEEPEVLAKTIIIEQPPPPKPISKPAGKKGKEKQAQLQGLI